jgi:methyl-accepting chemotaxis protein
MSVKYKLIAGYTVLILILLASSLVSSFSSGKQEAEVAELMSEDLPVMTSAQEIALLGLNYRRSEKDILLNMGDKAKQENYLKQLKADAQKLTAKAGDLATRVAADRELGEKDKAVARAVGENFRRYDAVVSAYLEDLASGRKTPTPVEANLEIAKTKDDFHNFEKALASVQESARKMVAEKGTTMGEIAQSLRVTQWGTLFGGLAVGVACAVVTILSISRPMRRILGYSSAVSSGDLEARLERQGTDEFAELGGNIEKMVGTLKTKIDEAQRMTREAADEAARARKATEDAVAATRLAEKARVEGMSEAAHSIEQVVAVVASASQLLLTRIEEASRGARDQSQRVEETMAAMREMNATVLDVAKSASQAADSTDRAKSDATAGSKVLAEVVESIRRVQAQALGLKGDMGDLGVKAEGIGRVMNVISDIADQTNLLALNAAIEAARAGDAGRGFAVVADEVRKLAEKTMTATREVGEAIQGIQQGTSKNIGNVEAAVDTIGKATELAERSGQALEGILDLVQQAADQVRSIATASEEQSAASEQINRSIEEINTISSGTTDNMRQSSGEVEELSRQAKVLTDLVLSLDSGGR